MTHITAKELVKAAREMSRMDEKKITAFFNNFEKKQPVLYTYIIANGENIKNEDAREDFTYIFSIIWKSYDNLKMQMQEISVKELEKKEKEHIKGWEKFASIKDPKKEEAFVATFINQPEIWDFMLDIVFPDENPDQSNFTENDTAIAFAVVNLMTDLLSGSLNGSAEKKKTAVKPAAKKATKAAPKKATPSAAKKTTKPAVKKAAKPATKKAVKPAAKKAAKPATKKTVKPATKKTVKPAVKKTVKPAAKKTSKPAPAKKSQTAAKKTPVKKATTRAKK